MYLFFLFFAEGLLGVEAFLVPVAHEGGLAVAVADLLDVGHKYNFREYNDGEGQIYLFYLDINP